MPRLPGISADAILAGLRDGLVVGAPDGTVLDVNDAFLDLVGLPREEVVGLSGPPYPWHADPEAALRGFERLRVDPRAQIELTYRRPSGETLPVQVTVSPLRAPEGELSALAVICRDVGPLRRAEQERRATEAMLAAEREARLLKDELLATVSHELRTPLSAVLGYLELALADVEDEDVRQMLEVAHRNGRRLSAIVGDVLLIGRASSGRLRLDVGPVRLGAVVREAAEAARAAAAERGVGVEEGPPADPVVLADAGRVREVVANLIANAVRFSPPGETVRVEVGAAGGRARVAVADGGPGVAPHERERVFEPFFRSVEAAADPAAGSGLGLAVARALAEAQDGIVGLETPDDGRTVLFAEWPAVAVEPGGPREGLRE